MLSALLRGLSIQSDNAEKTGLQHRYTLVIHGGAGTILKENSTPQELQAYRNALHDALLAGHEVLAKGGEAMDAAVAAVGVMEDCPLFNAGKGAVFNVDGKNELEASIMVSRPPSSHPEISSARRGSALTLLTRVKNPAKLVRALYLSPAKTSHPFISGPNAEAIAESLGETLVDPSYFFTERRWREHRRGLGLPEEPHSTHELPEEGDKGLDVLPKGTVGAVALDVRGCIVAVTSTGGRTNKLVGRIGDTPIFGAGFWAEEWPQVGDKPNAVGISGTGDGDYFIRQATASTIAHRVKFLGEPLEKAAQQAVDDLLVDGGLGGVIALDSLGNVAMPLNCPGMYRGVIREDGIPKTAVFADDVLT